MTALILTPPATTSGADWIASAPAAVQTEFLDSLTLEEVRALPYLFEFWAHDHQMPPEGDWRTWVILGGRGAGKTRAGSEWVRAQVEGATPEMPGRCQRIALIGETMDQVREVMIFGESGIMACSPPDRRPAWIAGRKMLVWPNGAVAHVFSARNPEALRGPQFDAVWADELGKWKDGQAAWDNIKLCLRLGDDPRACVTTTPRTRKVLKDLLEQSSSVVTTAPTVANRAYLASGFLDEVQRLYAGTRMGRQELDGVLIAEIDGALWPSDLIFAARCDEVPQLNRVVVAVDPSVSSNATSDACGIVVVGVADQGAEQMVYVLEDATIEGASPTQWAQAAVDAYARHGADRMVAEVNQGGDLVEQVVRQVDPSVAYRPVRATRGKTLRAEPVAALYERGLVKHAQEFDALEDQMRQMTTRGFAGGGSPDRVDALVWAIHDAVGLQSVKAGPPRLRAL